MSKFSFEKPGRNYSFMENSQSDVGDEESFPERLKEYDQWLVTHDKPWTDNSHKSPRFPTNWNSDGTLLCFEEAYGRFEQAENTGIAFRFIDNGPFVGFDFDKVSGASGFTSEVLELVQQLSSYTEVSSSGKGLHVIVEGAKLASRKSKGRLSDCGDIEVYDTDRYFILTGEVYDGYTSVKSRSTVAQRIQRRYLPTDERASVARQQKSVGEQEFDRGQVDATPEQVRQTIRAYTKSDKHDVDRAVLRLWKGDDEGRKSTSEADILFTQQLYFWCKGNRQLMDNCFRASGRMRDKWNKTRSSDGSTYGEMTIQKSCQKNNSIFEGSYVK